LRQEQANATRQRVIEAAVRLFAADGYARTTMARIAKQAGVSAETVQGQGPKAALLIAAVEYAAFGVAGEENIMNLEIGQTLLGIDDFDAAVDFMVAMQIEVHQRTAALYRALNAGALADPELERYRRALITGVDEQGKRVLSLFRERGWVRDDIPFDEVAATAAVLASVDSYLRLIERPDWTLDAYRTWLRRVTVDAVTGPRVETEKSS
jgi:AcrR family transcriptional regulator